MTSSAFTEDLFSGIVEARPTAKRSHEGDTVVQRLESIDWSFAGRTRHSELEALHPYPAKFIVEIPQALLKAVPPPDGTAVLDPFCGSGTTLAACQHVGVPSIGIDLNPIACLISRVRTGSLPDDIEATARRVIGAAAESSELCVPAIPNLDHWFKADVQLALSRLTAAIDSIGEPEERDILKLALSSIVVRVSNQDSDTRYAAVEKPVTYKDVFEAFKRSIVRILSALRTRPLELSPARVIEADTLSVTLGDISQKVGLVITSPPYPNAYEYWLYHKYRMWWLRRDPLAVKEKEIGARAHFFKKNHHTADDFIRQMGATFDLIRQVMIQGGYACFVVGRSKIHGALIDNAKIIQAAGHARGFQTIFAVEREISRHKKSFNLSHANIKTETVLVLRLGEA